MSNPLIKRKVQIFLALLLAFVIVRASSSTVFLANTPRINTTFISSIRYLPQTLPATIRNNADNFFAMIFPPQSLDNHNSQQNTYAMAEAVKKLPIASMLPLSKGVYAAQDGVSKVLYIHVTNDAEKAACTKRTITIDGEKVTVCFPKE